jgi:transcriptional regulator with PAS, ATPase and Fis domain
MKRRIGGFMEAKTLLALVDRMYDELMIYDNNYRLVYVNQACARHYGHAPDQMIGKCFFDFFDAKWWHPSLLPVVYERKKTMGINQKTFTGCELLSIGAPAFDEEGNIEYVVMNVRDMANGIEHYNPPYSFEERTADTKFSLVVESDAMKQVINLVNKIKNVDATCILLGESGTGKSIIAKYLHSIGSRKNHPFIALNCANIPGELLEAELFGYVRGAFTGASANGKKGIFEAANRGTIFLDEVAELTMAAQAKLLHVLQENEFFPLGSSKPVAADVRIIAATNRNLKEMVRKGQFREDLYYRLNVIDIYIPPLRERKKDIISLIHHFMNFFCVKYGITKQFTEEALNALANYAWPGNVRELQHSIERLVITVDGPIIDVADLSGMIAHPEGRNNPEACPAGDSSLEEQMEKHEAFLVREAWQKCRSSRKMASYFSISQSKANNLIRKYIPKEQG